MYVYAQEDIEEDQEIFNSYIDLDADTKTRQMKLFNNFNFICKCRLCSRRNGTEVKLSDRRRNQQAKLIQDFNRLQYTDPRKALKTLDKLFEILKLEDMIYHALYTAKLNEVYLRVLVKYFQKKKENARLISDFAKYTLGNYTIAFGKAFADREYGWAKKYLS